MSSKTDSSFILANGRWQEAGDPVIPLQDRALAMGAGLFETMAAYRGRVFALQKHIDRLDLGLRKLGIELGGRDPWESLIDELLKRNHLDTHELARIRITVSAGSTATGAQWFIEASPAPNHADTARLISGPFVRNERSLLVGLKSINYGDNVVAMKLAREAGATEALFGNTRDRVCEGTWSNLFLKWKGRWLTPPLSSGCLPGVTRETVLQLSAESGHPIEEADLPLSEIENIESAFLTSSIREIQPVESIDGLALPSPQDPQILGWKQAFSDYVNS